MILFALSVYSIVTWFFIIDARDQILNRLSSSDEKQGDDQPSKQQKQSTKQKHE